jgi:hypothetical protein
VRIISPFVDYYDSAVGYDDEATPLYLRQTSALRLRGAGGNYYGPPKEWQAGREDQDAEEAMRRLHGELLICRRPFIQGVSAFLVGLCGGVAYGWRFRGRAHWSPQALLDAAASDPELLEDRRDLRYRLDYERSQGIAADPPTSSLPDVDPALRAETAAIFRALDTPCFLVESDPHDGWWRGCTLTRNPILRELAFARIVDPYSARQAVETYLGNELAKQIDPNEGISDEDRRDMKGFGEPSFRAGKGGPGRTRKRKRKQ